MIQRTPSSTTESELMIIQNMYEGLGNDWFLSITSEGIVRAENIRVEMGLLALEASSLIEAEFMNDTEPRSMLARYFYDDHPSSRDILGIRNPVLPIDVMSYHASFSGSFEEITQVLVYDPMGRAGLQLCARFDAKDIFGLEENAQIDVPVGELYLDSEKVDMDVVEAEYIRTQDTKKK